MRSHGSYKALCHRSATRCSVVGGSAWGSSTTRSRKLALSSSQLDKSWTRSAQGGEARKRRKPLISGSVPLLSSWLLVRTTLVLASSSLFPSASFAGRDGAKLLGSLRLLLWAAQIDINLDVHSGLDRAFQFCLTNARYNDRRIDQPFTKR